MAMSNPTLWLRELMIWAVVLAVPAWLLAEEILHRLPSLSPAPRMRARRIAKPSGPAVAHRVTAA
jgi:hypothetical protein